MKVKLSEVAEGSLFTKDGVEFKKLPTVKISCCRSINAEQTENANNRVFINPGDEVEVNDQLQ
ncbi:MAG: hypothetical protein EBS93_07950 [Chitinophagia bacterium]|nr:hypothetical protein [Chitinophagia bacterium]NCA30634.1 hypothetical protein [Chitinophagia bacterium]